MDDAGRFCNFRNPSFPDTARRRNRTFQARGCPALPVLPYPHMQGFCVLWPVLTGAGVGADSHQRPGACMKTSRVWGVRRKNREAIA